MLCNPQQTQYARRFRRFRGTHSKPVAGSWPSLLIMDHGIKFDPCRTGPLEISVARCLLQQNASWTSRMRSESSIYQGHQHTAQLDCGRGGNRAEARSYSERGVVLQRKKTERETRKTRGTRKRREENLVSKKPRLAHGSHCENENGDCREISSTVSRVVLALAGTEPTRRRNALARLLHMLRIGMTRHTLAICSTSVFRL